jgi:hypothetical protein
MKLGDVIVIDGLYQLEFLERRGNNQIELGFRSLHDGPMPRIDKPRKKAGKFPPFDKKVDQQLN